MNLLKNIGKGILYIIGLPFFLIVLSVTAVAGLFMLIFMFFKSIILFFTGRSLDDDLPEDKKAKAIKNGKTINEQPQPQVVQNQPQQPYQSNGTQTNIEQIVFGPKPIENEEVSFETINEPISEPVIDKPIFEQIETESKEPVQETIIEAPKEKPVKEQPKKETKISKYVPKTGNSRFIEDTSLEEDEDSGVTITYGDDDE